MGLDLEEAASVIGRFDIAERSDSRLLLVARSRTQAHSIERARWYLAPLVVSVPALGAALWDGVVATFLLGLTGIVFAIVVMIDFLRVASDGKIITVEHRFELEPDTQESYRGAPSPGRLIADGRVMPMPVREVRVISETIAKTGEEQCRVYLFLEGPVLVLETTNSRVTALRLAGLVRKTLRMAPLAGVQRELSAGMGGGWASLFFLIAIVIPMIVAPMATVLASAPLHVAALGGALVVGLLGLEYALAIPMRASVGDYIEQRFRT